MATDNGAADFPPLLTRTCPMCGETVELAASKCGACGETIHEVLSRKKSRTRGIGGWLILPAIGAVISPPWYLFVGGMLLLATIGMSSDTLGIVRAFVGLLGLSICAFGAYSVYVAVRFFQKKKSAPNLMITRYIISIVITWSDHAVAVASDAEPDERALTRAVWSTIFTIIWIAYFLKSERVKNTFVN